MLPTGLGIAGDGELERCEGRSPVVIVVTLVPALSVTLDEALNAVVNEDRAKVD